MIRSLAALAVSCLALAPVPQEIKADVLEKLKSATVYVVAADGTGSGFLFLKRGSSSYIMTCEHVVGTASEVKVVFWSGTPKEKTLVAKVVATDPHRDIACLVLKDAKDLPTPLELGRKTEVRETETVVAAGFPFGGMLATGKKNPEIAISKSSVTSIRRGENGDTIAVQISGEVNPGNSGGPLVTVDGRVVGVTALKIMGTQTAFAVPPEEIQGFLKGRIKASTFRKVGGTDASGKYEVRLGLVDPLATLKSVGIAWINESKVKDDPAPEKDGTWKKAHPSMTTQDFAIEEDHAVKTIEFKREGKETDLVILFQCYFTQSDGKNVWTGPGTVDIAFGAGADSAASGGRGRRNPPGTPKESPAEPEPPAPELPSGPVVSLALPDDPKFVAELKVSSVWGGLILAPDGSALYALDLSEGQLCKLDPETLKVVAQLAVHEWSVAMALSPDGKTLVVGGRSPTSSMYDGGPNAKNIRGRLQVVNTATFTTTSTLDLKGAVVELAVTDRGLVAASSVEQWGGVVIVDIGQKTEEAVQSIYGGACVRLSRDQRKVYLGDRGLSPADFRCVLLTKSGNQYPSYDSVYHGDYPLGGTFELSPDGRFLIGAVGSVVRLGRSKDADLKFLKKIDPFQCAAVAPGCGTLVTASPDGFLKSYGLDGFELQKSVKVGHRVERMVLDTKRRKLFMVYSELAGNQRHMDRELKVGRIGAIALGAP